MKCTVSPLAGDAHFRVGLGRADCKALFERWDHVADAAAAATTGDGDGAGAATGSELAQAAEAYVRAMEGRLEGGSPEDGRPVGY